MMNRWEDNETGIIIKNIDSKTWRIFGTNLVIRYVDRGVHGICTVEDDERKCGSDDEYIPFLGYGTLTILIQDITSPRIRYAVLKWAMRDLMTLVNEAKEEWLAEGD